MCFFEIWDDVKMILNDLEVIFWCLNEIKKKCNKNIKCLILILLYVNGCVGSDVVYILEDILGYVFL